MPQLRHAETSALIAESTNPSDLVAVAREVGLERVMFDDVGTSFDVNAALEQLEQFAAATNLDQASASVAGLLDVGNPDAVPVHVALIRPPTPPVLPDVEPSSPSSEPE